MVTITWTRGFAVTCVALLLAVASVRSSTVIGVYAIVERVILEPNETSPQRIQVWGAFLPTAGPYGAQLGTPAYGYVYYTPREGEERIARSEWMDLKSVAGSGRIIAYGALPGRFMYGNGRIRREGTKAEGPDPYPIGTGIVSNISNANVGSPLAETMRTHKGPPPDIRILGRVVLEGGAAIPNRLSIWATSVDGSVFSVGTGSRSVGADGSFDLHLIAGKFHMDVFAPSDDFYVKSISDGTRNVFDSDLVLGSTPPGLLTVRLAADGTTFHGTVLDGDRKPSDAFLLLAPLEKSRRQNPIRYKITSPDIHGQFAINNIEPGDYTVFVWNRAPTVDFKNADFVAKHESDGHAISLPLKADADLKFKMIPFKP